MAVNREVKGNLARLLATEDLVVEHKKVETACFNVHTRVLTLPLWEKASGTVYDLLVGHEVGHALFTPDEDWNNNVSIPKQFVNVVEDARIEKLMRRKYAGLNKTFYNGYNELYREDFFMIGDDDITEYNLADRVNLYFKVGNFLLLKFDGEEKEIVDQIGSVETFADVLEASKRLYEYCKKKHEEVDKSQEFMPHEFSKNSSNQNTESEKEEISTSSQESKESTEKGEEPAKVSEEDKNNENKTEEENNAIGNGASEKGTGVEVKTANSLEESVKELVNPQGYENVYLEIPKVNLDKVIIPNEEVYEICKQHWNYEGYGLNVFQDVDQNYKEFKNSAQKEVNYLVKEFDRKKAADSYARSSVSKTGVLDCTKLHTYKFNEDLFKRVTTFADGKNHGLIFILDWSGSMSSVLLDTIKQLYNLIWFCRKTNIPFDVYAFVSDWATLSQISNPYVRQEPMYEVREDIFSIDNKFALLHFFTSKINSKELESQMKDIYRIAMCYSYNSYSCSNAIRVRYSCPQKLALTGTPLNESLVSLHQIIPKFKKENKLQKVHCVILTDGEAHTLYRHVLISKRLDRDPYFGVSGVPFNSFLRDRKLGTTYSLTPNDVFCYREFSDVLLKNLRDNFPDVSFIGIRILSSRDANSIFRTYLTDPVEYNKTASTWKKEKCFTIKNSGYNVYLGLSSNALSNSVDFEIAPEATKGQIKIAFSKSLKNKKMNKKILNEFVEQIA